MSKTTFLLGLLVLVLATGGTATAAKLLTGKDVKNGSLTGADLKNGSIAGGDLAASARPRAGAAGAAGPAGAKGATGGRGPAGADTGFTRAQADARFQGRTAVAADADKLAGTDRDDLAAGDGEVEWGTTTRAFNSDPVRVVDLGGIGDVRVTCGPGGDKSVVLTNDTQGSTVLSSAQRRSAATPVIAAASINTGGGATTVATGSGNYQLTAQVMRGGSTQEFVTLVLTATDDNLGSCRFTAHAVSRLTD